MSGPAPRGFRKPAVEAGFRKAMQVGQPEDAALRPVFLLPAATTVTPVDARGIPWDITAEMEPGTTELTGVLCAYELAATGTTDNREQSGTASQDRAVTITLLEDEYQQVKDCVAVRIGESTFPRWHDLLPYAVATAGVYQLRFRAEDMA